MKHAVLIMMVALGACVEGFGDDGDWSSPPPFTSSTSTPLEPVVTSAEPPPPIRGGTLLVASDGFTALASDADRDIVWIADLNRGNLTASIELGAGDEPNRIVEAGAGFFVTLIGSSEIAHIERDGWTIDYRRSVCAAPRGMAYDSSSETLFVACAGGELVSLPVAGHGRTSVPSVLHLDPDLRDIVLDAQEPGLLWVSRFRSAEVLMVSTEARVPVRRRVTLPTVSDAVPAVAWRMVAAPEGGVLVVHQRAHTDVASRAATVPSGQTYYGGLDFCSPGVVEAAMSEVHANGTVLSSPGVRMVLPVDMAVSGTRKALVAAGAANPSSESFRQGGPAATSTSHATDSVFVGCAGFADENVVFDDGRQAIAVAFDGRNNLVLQTRDPWQIVVTNGVRINLPGADRKDSGHDLFHEDAGAGIACASCHAEGGDDAVTWDLPRAGFRRTQDIRGGILGTEPFHWAGDMPNFRALFDEVFVNRMSGGIPDEAHAMAVGNWIDTLEGIPPIASNVGAAERGRAIFNDRDVGCASCHSGARLTNNQTRNVGTGGAFQVPSLVGVGTRAPFLHNGCARTLRDRFGACGGGERHGHTEHLSEAQLHDLIAHLETL